MFAEFNGNRFGLGFRVLHIGYRLVRLVSFGLGLILWFQSFCVSTF